MTSHPTEALEPAVTGDGRGVLIARLRLMAAWLEDNPGLPLSPYIPVTITQFASTEEEARAIRRAAPDGWRKNMSPQSDWVTYEHGEQDSRWEVTYELHVSKEVTACERVQVGTRHVEEHDEPVYEWKCAPDA